MEKGLGKLGLNDAMINRLQSYFGMALRSNVATVEDMKNNIYAALMHICSNKENNCHWKYCPAGSDSWCSFQRDIANGTNLHVPGRGLHPTVILHVKKNVLGYLKMIFCHVAFMAKPRTRTKPSIEQCGTASQNRHL